MPRPLISEAKGFGVGLKAMKTLKPEELANAINTCSRASWGWAGSDSLAGSKLLLGVQLDIVLQYMYIRICICNM